MKPEKLCVKDSLECAYCTKTFKYDSERKRHELSHCPQFECSVCAKKFSFLSALKRHEKQHKRTGSVKCEECGGQFRDEILLKRHIQYAHKGEFMCSKCNTTLNSETALRIHMKVHKPVSERKYQCRFPNCEKSFNYSHHLKHHELTHTNEKQHYCDICNKGFIQTNHWKAHMRTHEPEKWLKCSEPTCQKKFATKYAKKRHECTHKNGPDANSPIADSITQDDSCGETVYGQKYARRNSKSNVDKQDNASSDDTKDSFSSQGDHYDDSDMKVELETKIEVHENSVKVHTGVKDCTAAVGGCLVASSGDRNCLCAQMTTTVDEYYDLAPADNAKQNISSSAPIPELKEFPPKNTEYVVENSNNMCEGCDCASTCSVPIKLKSLAPKIDTIEPVLDLKIDGTIKIKNTYDLDLLENRLEDEKKNKKCDNYMPYNSCKEVLGKCIVSGNGTMGEGCLCARMINDEQQMIAQEMEEIIPRPKSDWQY